MCALWRRTSGLHQPHQARTRRLKTTADFVGLSRKHGASSSFYKTFTFHYRGDTAESARVRLHGRLQLSSSIAVALHFVSGAPSRRAPGRGHIQLNGSYATLFWDWKPQKCLCWNLIKFKFNKELGNSTFPSVSIHAIVLDRSVALLTFIE